MRTVISKDGTKIAYERTGSGAPVIVVDGALCYRASGPARPMAAELAADFSVITYDRRGRGESEAGEFTVEREVEDLAALVKEAGGSAYLFGPSSGGLLALEAASQGIGVTKLALYEPPIIVDDTHAPEPADTLPKMRALVADSRRSAAVKTFMKSVGVPGFFVGVMPLMPVWSKLKGVAHTLPNDLALTDGLRQGKPLPTDRWTMSTQPTLVADGGKSPEYLRNSARAMASVLPSATYLSVPGQTHLVKAKALAPVLRDFFLE